MTRRQAGQAMIECLCIALLALPMFAGLGWLADSYSTQASLQRAVRAAVFERALTLTPPPGRPQASDYLPAREAVGVQLAVTNVAMPARATQIVDTTWALLEAGRITGLAAPLLERGGWVRAEATASKLFLPVEQMRLNQRAQLSLLTDAWVAADNVMTRDRVAAMSNPLVLRNTGDLVSGPLAVLFGFLEPNIGRFCVGAPNPDVLPRDRLGARPLPGREAWPQLRSYDFDARRSCRR